MSAVEWITSTAAQQLVMTPHYSKQFHVKKHVLTAKLTLL